MHFLLGAGLVFFGLKNALHASRVDDTDKFWPWLAAAIFVGGFFILRSLRRK
jgi:hypothetical protein